MKNLNLIIILFCSCVVTTACGQKDVQKQIAMEQELDYFINEANDTIFKIRKSEETWKNELSKQTYNVLRKKGTERAFTGEYWDNKVQGTYTCAGCGLPLFSSETKYRSGSGWPSFYQPLDSENVARITDETLGMVRTEVLWF